MTLNWISPAAFTIGGYTITCDYALGGSKRQSTDHDFTIMKARNFFDHYTSLIHGNYKKILELGVYQGGSFVFLDQLLKPSRIAGIEISNVPIPGLDKYVAENGDHARLYYGTSQDDVARLRTIVDEDFGGELDLVVDDASHLYELTKASFTTLFPLVRPGGLYIIEDWSWSFEAPYQEPDNCWFNQSAPANLMLDLMEDMTMRKLIESVHVERELLKIRRSQHSGGELFTSQARRGRQLNLL